MWDWIKFLLGSLFNALRIASRHKKERELAAREAHQREKQKVEEFENNVQEEIEAMHRPAIDDDDPMGVDAWNRGK